MSNKYIRSNAILFIPITDEPTWFSQETATTERGRFLLSRPTLTTMALVDTLGHQEKEFSFMFDLYKWFEEEYGYEILFAQLVESQ